MDRIKEEIGRYIKSKYTVSSRSDKRGFCNLIESNNKAIDNFMDSISENIETFVKDNTDTILSIIKDRSNNNPNKYIHAAEWAVRSGKTNWNEISDALLQVGPNKIASARRKLKYNTGYYLDDIDIQRLRKIGVDI